MSSDIREKWNGIYSQSGEKDRQPCEVLRVCSHLLPDHGNALDAACGLGGNAVFLAKHGLNTLALDISEVAIHQLEKLARRLRLPLQARQQDLEDFSWQAEQFDVIVISRFLERKLTNAIIEALKPEGLLFYQTFIREKVTETGPNNPDYLLAENELLRLFQSLSILFYREEGCVGNTEKGFRNEAMLVGQRRVTS